MESITLDHGIIRSWAEFSGDWNPIHFDHEAARHLGVADVVVHGMIPILLAQGEVTRDLPVYSGWRECSVRLKRPIASGVAIHFTQRRTDRGAVRFSFCDALGTPYFTGVVQSLEVPALASGSDPPRSVAVELGSFRLPVAELRARGQRFLSIFPQLRSPWITLSATLFAEFLSRGMVDLRAASLASLELPSDAAVNEVIAVQTTYKVAFDQERLHPHSFESCREIECIFAPIEPVRLADSCAAECCWDVGMDGVRVMQTSVGLLLKIYHRERASHEQASRDSGFPEEADAGLPGCRREQDCAGGDVH